MSMTGELLTKRDYQDALTVQDACNLSGVVFSFARVMEKICNEANRQGKGTEWKNTHPIAIAYASKIADLTGEHQDFGKAYDQIQMEITVLERMEAIDDL